MRTADRIYDTLCGPLRTIGLLTATITLIVTPLGSASAHQAMDLAGFTSGFVHPFGGADHLVAMVAVGLWGAFLGQPAIWALPVVFPVVMAVGGALGIVGPPMPLLDQAIAISGIVLGGAVALAARPPMWIAGTIVGAFAIFHGYAHGLELPAATDPVAYSLGFVSATGLLHLSGIGLGLLARWPVGKLLVRTIGGVIAIAGLAFLAAG